jgi:hypothetical protein
MFVIPIPEKDVSQLTNGVPVSINFRPQTLRRVGDTLRWATNVRQILVTEAVVVDGQKCVRFICD